MTPLEPDSFVALRGAIEAHPRLGGYYILKFVGIADLRAQRKTEEEIAEIVFQYFDDQKWPPLEQRPKDQTWTDYLADQTTARIKAIEVLVGGRPIGHLNVTIPEPQAAEYVDRFDAMFPHPKTYYVGMGFGDQKYVFSGGIAIISCDVAGCLWVVEDD